MNRTGLLLLLALSACTAPSLRLADDREDSATIDIGGDRRVVLAPPFPAARRIEVEVPEAGFLRFSPALVTEQTVRRARVSYRVAIEVNGESVVAYDETFRFRDANQWHDREVDLAPWAGERVAVVLTTTTPEERTDILWADRVRAVWGEPIVISSPGRQLTRSADVAVDDAEQWFVEQMEPVGFAAETLFAFVGNLLLAGILGLVIRELYLRFALMGSRRDAYGNLFPLFSVTTVLVIIVVQSSLALSLGLIGALSIVRFRTAIKTPEEIGYLLFCISVGVALGAQQRLMALTSVVFVSLLVIVMHRRARGSGSRYLLTVSGEAASFYDPEAGSALERLRPLVRELEMQRLEQEGERVELRAIVTVDDASGVSGLMTRLHSHLPRMQFSFVEADDVL